MLQRSAKLLRVFHNISRYSNDCLYIFQVGYARRCATTLITCNHNTRYKLQDTIQIVTSSQVFGTRTVGHQKQWKWLLVAMTRSISVAAKTWKDESGNMVKKPDHLQQTIIELKEENLGQLKERKLNVEPISTVDNQSKKQKQQDLKAEGMTDVSIKKDFFYQVICFFHWVSIDRRLRLNCSFYRIIFFS